MVDFLAVLLIVLFCFVVYIYIKKIAYNNSSENKLKEIITNFDSKNDSKMHNFIKKLKNINYSDNDGILIIEWIISCNLEKKYDDVDFTILFNEVLLDKSLLYLKYLKENYDKISYKYRSLVLDYISWFRTNENYKFFINSLTNDFDKLNRIPLTHLKEKPIFSEIIFPKLLPFIFSEKSAQILDLMNQYLEKKLLYIDKDQIYKEQLLKKWTQLEKTSLEFSFKEYKNRIKVENELLILIDIFAYLYDEEIILLLKEKTKSSNENIKTHALISLIMLGNEEEGVYYVFENLSEKIECRTFLFEKLKQINRNELFPVKYYTQKFFSEGDIYRKIKADYNLNNLVLTSEKNIAGNLKIYYYKFNYFEENSISKWYVAVSGPFLTSEKPQITGLGLTNYKLIEYSENLTNVFKDDINRWTMNYNS
ncbi:hypothetical protein [Helicovermis profundi]|uniref:Uncharacterized protein n=1 Tax=Helicovermis profundi TaxID=3065157 RepID=A0AAU9E440_9FIRM|nr:hypothetical protein HLPR_14990 [Clostridia bacterium S502]